MDREEYPQLLSGGGGVEGWFGLDNDKASLLLLRAVQLRVELHCTIVVLFVDSFLPFLQSGPGNSRGIVKVRKAL